MKKPLIFQLALIAAVGCSSATEADYREPQVELDSPVEITLSVGESATVGDTDLRATFVGIVEDSRCPVDVTCVWEGNAAAEVQLSLGDEPVTTVRVNTSVAPSTVDYDAVSFTITQLTPEPVQSVPTRPEDYQLTLRFTQR